MVGTQPTRKLKICQQSKQARRNIYVYGYCDRTAFKLRSRIGGTGNVPMESIPSVFPREFCGYTLSPLSAKQN